jgi:hypothetical protein
MRISSSGLDQREYVTRIAILSLVSTMYLVVNVVVIIIIILIPYIDNGITPSGFLLCNAEDFDHIRLTIIGKKLFLRTFTEVKG